MKIIIGNLVYVWLDDFIIKAVEDVPKAWRMLADEIHKKPIIFDDGTIVVDEQ